MKKTLLKTMRLLVAGVIAIIGLTGCVGGNSWWDYPGDDWGYSDRRLAGYWQLVQYNSDPVYPNEANYLYFNGNGTGLYYYLDNGFRECERLRYWCQNSYGSASPYQINIQYEYSSPLTTSYWFTHGNNTLWLQWQTGNGRVQTYVYDRIQYAPW